LLLAAWHGPSSQALLDSLSIAGVDGKLVQRMKSGAAAGQAWLETGTLSGAGALAGYVRVRAARSTQPGLSPATRTLAMRRRPSTPSSSGSPTPDRL